MSLKGSGGALGGVALPPVFFKRVQINTSFCSAAALLSIFPHENAPCIKQGIHIVTAVLFEVYRTTASLYTIYEMYF